MAKQSNVAPAGGVAPVSGARPPPYPVSGFQEELNVTSPGSARNARPRRNAVSKDASSTTPDTASAAISRAATVAKASKTTGTTKRVANGRAAAIPAPEETSKNGKPPRASARTRDAKDLPLFEDIR
jgi:phosphoenolpyruvate carboxylase